MIGEANQVIVTFIFVLFKVKLTLTLSWKECFDNHFCDVMGKRKFALFQLVIESAAKLKYCTLAVLTLNFL